MLVRSRKQTPVFIVIPFHTTSGSSRVQSRTILAPSWNWHSALGFSLGLSRTTLAPPWSWHSAQGFDFAVESDNASPILELAFGTRSSISRLPLSDAPSAYQRPCKAQSSAHTDSISGAC
ncbi:hypothetical protein B0H17DRAFT_1148764 [Mycena rosella]|uniref:Uncharacterized protein n=1 Tax=Mycena rosella TaxID=1033263 RepID=A0AAD7C9B2_MYCRO|nr:hypothetical protein B0H17DRAFT_1148764 [Mycena rosella]